MATDGYFGAPSHLRQARCDAIKADFWTEQSARRTPAREAEARPSIRRRAPPFPPALVPTDDVLKLRLADELEYARRMIETMGDSLSSDPHLVARHMVTLQAQGLKFNPRLMLIQDADVPAMWYHRLKKEWTTARTEGRDFVNPVQETTLRWRS